MSFCPTTAALFFGSLIPLAVNQESALLIPLAYALGVALPVCFFALLIIGAAHQVQRWFNTIKDIEPWIRRITGTIFLCIGTYFTLRFTLGLL